LKSLPGLAPGRLGWLGCLRNRSHPSRKPNKIGGLFRFLLRAKRSKWLSAPLGYPEGMPRPTPVLLMVRSLGLGGTERQLTEIARFLDRNRFTPYVGCLIADGMRKAEIDSAGIPLLTLPVSSFMNPSAMRGAWQLASFIRRHNIQVVHTFDVPMNLFGVLPARLAGAPVVLSSQRAHRALTPPAGRRLLRVMDRIVDGVVVNCEAMKEHLRVDEGVPAGRIHVCYNGINANIYHPGPVQRPAPLRTGTVIGVLCALRPEKGLNTLIEGFAGILREFPHVKLAIVGSGSEEQPLKKLAGSFGITESCHFEPGTREVVRWLRCIDIFVLPSLSEALSNSLMEAMACGCCPVASRVGGNPELVVPGTTGLLFEPGSAKDLAAQLRLLILNQSLRHEYAEASAKRIALDFTHSAAATRMGDIYEDNLYRKIFANRATLAAT
jgi:glycosyltransferase involved in cell wall biosynthesis